MQIFSSLLFGISASLDAFLVGITYGIRKIHISFLQNVFISLITLAGTVLSIGLGMRIVPFFPPQAAQYAGSGILMAMGLYYIIKFMYLRIKKYLIHRHDPSHELSKASKEKENTPPSLTLKESVLLGLALSVNNMGIGVGASIAGLTLGPAAAMTLLFSVLFLLLGNRLGKIKLLHMAGSAADPLSGLLLMGLGLCELLF